MFGQIARLWRRWSAKRNPMLSYGGHLALKDQELSEIALHAALTDGTITQEQHDLRLNELRRSGNEDTLYRDFRRGEMTTRQYRQQLTQI